jgi:hypothetical protein
MVNMTREDVLKLFPDATDEQITKILNQHHAELTKEKTKTETYKEQSKENEELKKQLEEINNAKLSDIEKANKERDEALEKLNDSTKTIQKMNQKIALADKGITGEDADKLIESLAGGNFDIEIFAKIIADREQASAIAKEKEIAGNSGNPNGGNGNGGAESKPEDVLNAESISFGSVTQNAQATRDLYR